MTDNTTFKEMGILAKIAYYDKYLSGNPQVVEEDPSYTVIDSINTASNLQALLLQKNNGEYVIAFRGTQEWQDWISNGLTGLYNYNPQVEAALDWVKEILANPPAGHTITTSNLTLTGHSLGGIITQVVGAELGIEGYAYNPYGANILTSLPAMPLGMYSVFSQILDLFNATNRSEEWLKENMNIISYQDGGSLNGDILSNLATNFSRLVSGNDHLGSYLPVFGMSNADGVIAGHSMDTLNEAIKNYDLLISCFSNQLGYKEISSIFIAQGLEPALKSMATIMGVSKSGDSQSLFNAIVGNGQSGFQLKHLGGMSQDTIISLAESNSSYLYSLQELNSFVIEGADYSSIAQPGYDDIANVSETFLKDRALFLFYLYHPDITVSNFETDIDFIDKKLGIEIEVDNGMIDANMDREYPWGTEGQDIFNITFDAGDDHLYGMGGNDEQRHLLYYVDRVWLLLHKNC